VALYALMYSYTSATWGEMTARPSDRSPAVRAAAEELGGAPVAMSAVATATGAYRHVETHALIEPSALPAVLTTARTVGERFVRPGA
jgi:hypothetical protein